MSKGWRSGSPVSVVRDALFQRTTRMIAGWAGGAGTRRCFPDDAAELNLEKPFAVAEQTTSHLTPGRKGLDAGSVFQSVS